jgi:hypothetical protein
MQTLEKTLQSIGDFRAEEGGFRASRRECRSIYPKF